MQAPAPDRLEILDAVIEVDDSGRHHRGRGRGLARGPSPRGGGRRARGHAARLPVLLPGLVDLHVHAPQWPQLGTGLDLPLERWLFEYTFPLEARSPTRLRGSVWERMVPTLLRHGTTTAVYYATVHEEATLALAETCRATANGRYVGRVEMDDPDGTPPYRDASADAGVAASAAPSRRSGRWTPPAPGGRRPPRPAHRHAALHARLHRRAARRPRRARRRHRHPRPDPCSECDWEHGHARSGSG